MTVLLELNPNKVWETGISLLRQEFPDVEFVFSSDPPAGLLGEVDVIVSTKVSAATIAQAPRLKVILIPIAGITHLPLKQIVDRGIRIGNTHGNSAGVAERAVSMILAFYGKIIDYHLDLKQHRWHGFWVGQGLEDTWESVQGKRVSILGAGGIGRYVARYLKVFDCTITGFKRTKSAIPPAEYDRMVYDVDEAIDGAEIVVVALPSTESTRGLIGAERLARMRGALLVNVGRGDIIDEQALYEGCRDGVLRGAAIDTWYKYPDGETSGAPSRFPFETLPNVVLSPHIAGFTRLSAERCVVETIDNLRAWLSREELVFEADPVVAY